MAGVVQQFPLEEEYKKPTGISPEDIKQLQEWLKTQPHLPADHITELDLILAYHSCNRGPEEIKKVLDLHYTLRTLLVNFFKDRDVDERVEKTLNTALLQPLPRRTKEGYAVMYMRLLDFDPKNYVVVDVVRTTFMIMDLWQYEDGTWPGFILLIDMEGSTFSHVTKWDMNTLQQFTYYLQEAMFLHTKAFHFLNATPFMDRLTSMLKPFMKKSLHQILHIHQAGSNSLEKYFPIEGLPKECGGKYKTYEECKNDTIAKLKANREFFVCENKKRVEESLRPGRPRALSDYFGGLFGTFKKLTID